MIFVGRRRLPKYKGLQRSQQWLLDSRQIKSLESFDIVKYASVAKAQIISKFNKNLYRKEKHNPLCEVYMK